MGNGTQVTTNPRPHQLLDTLRHLGYSTELIEWDYPVWLGDTQARADLVAFSRKEPKDMSTAALVVELSSAGTLSREMWTLAAEIGRSLAAPLVGVADSAGLALATVTRDGGTRPLVDLPFGETNLSSVLREQLNPRHVFEMKTGSRQPGLFPIDVSLLDYARRMTEDRLAPRVERALTTAFEYLGYERQEESKRAVIERSHKRASRLVVGALAALVLRDKEGQSHLSPGALIDTVMQRYPQDFSWVQSLSGVELDGLTGLLAGLGDDINFKSLDPLVLSGVYESTLVSDITRRQLGTHYTPPGLSRRMLAELPVEFIAPGERSVLDPTCGSGGLLLAAHDRLRALQPGDWDLNQSHRELAEHLRGFDTDAFAVEIARLSLFLHAMPAGNGWDVRHHDALRARIPKSSQPSIIVANPPWRNTNTKDGTRVEAADRFLRWMLANLQPGGLLAVVLPIGWLRNKSSEAARAAVRTSCNLFEIWRLPKGTFSSGKMAPAVLFAQKRMSSLNDVNPLLIRRVFRKSNLDSFYRGLSDSETYLADAEKLSNQGPLITGPLTSAYVDREIPTLSSVATVTAGPQPKSDLSLRSADDANCMYLTRLSGMRPFIPVSQDNLVPARFPDDFQTGRGAIGLGRRKVIVPATSGPDTPWRVWAGIDLHGILVRNSMHMVIPHEDRELFLLGLMAFLGSAFVSAWIDECAVERNIRAADLMSLPAPYHDPQWGELAELGREAIANGGRPENLAGIARAIDDLVWEFLDVPVDVRDIVKLRLSEFAAPEGSFRYPPPSSTPSPRDRNGRVRSRIGVVHAVSGGRLLIQVIGTTLSDGVWVEPPPGLPAALCRPGATFDVLISDGAPLNEGQFFYQPESWMDTETLLSAPAYHEATSAQRV
jgi:hypothetical protein